MSQQPKPRPVVLGLRILVICLIVGIGELAVLTFWGTDHVADSNRTILAIMLAAIFVPTAAIYVTLLSYAGRGRAWARNLLAGWLIATIALHIYIAVDVGTEWPYNAVQYSTTFFETIGVALLFTRDARVWYRGPHVTPGAV